MPFIPFAIDTGNGALGPLAKKVFSAFGLKTKYLFYEPDGHFPNHHPDPTVEKNLVFLKTKIQKDRAWPWDLVLTETVIA